MLKIKFLFLAIMVFFVLDDYVIAENNHTKDNEDQSYLVAQRKKVRKKRPKSKRRRKKGVRRPKKPLKKARKPQRTFKRGFYAEGGLQYYMPSSIDFMPAIKLGSLNNRITEADIIHSGGPGINLAGGYRIYKYLAVQLDLFLVYPLVGSEMRIDRVLDNVLTEGVDAGAKVIIPRLFIKGIYPLPIKMPIDVFGGAGIGYTQLIKTVKPEEEGLAFAGLSFHGRIGAKYEWKHQLSFGGSLEYVMASYNYVDVFDLDIYDNTNDGGVSLSQSMMIFGANITYTF